jgi:NAD-dependent deacetylase
MVLDWKKDLNLGEKCSHGHQLRPHIVWFGEEVPLLSEAAQITITADILIIIGTSMQVYPAAGLLNYVRQGIPIYFVDPKPNINASAYNNLKVIKSTAAKGVPILVKDLIRKEL